MSTVYFKNKRGFSPGSVIFKSVGVILLIVYTILILVPLFWALSVSLKSLDGFVTNPLLPNEFKISNYKEAFKLLYVNVYYDNGTSDKIYMAGLFANSILYSVGSAFAYTLAPCMMAYVVAKYKYRFNKVIYMLVIIKLTLPVVGSLPSEMQIARIVRTYDSMIGAWVMKFSFMSTNFLIFLSIFKNLSWGYAEAAFIDGASHFTVYVRIMLPLIKTTFFSLMLLSFISFWNDYYTPMIYLPSMPTLSYGLYYYSHSSGQGQSTIPMQMSACMIACIPILVLFLCMRKKLMGSLTLGGLKG